MARGSLRTTEKVKGKLGTTTTQNGTVLDSPTDRSLKHADNFTNKLAADALSCNLPQEGD
jgi:hypothetical protein